MNDAYWQEDTQAASGTDDVLDLVFSITCHSLPLDHAWLLSTAIQAQMPWWISEPLAGLHLIHGSESGNGWQRPEGADTILYVSRRAKLTLRLPCTRIADTRAALQGKTLTVADFSLVIGSAVERPLSRHSAQYARHVVNGPTADEEIFLAGAAQALQRMAISFKKMLAGKSRTVMTPEGPCLTRSLWIADLRPTDAVELQRRGIGPWRTLGCGLFVPYKTLSPSQDLD